MKDSIVKGFLCPKANIRRSFLNTCEYSNFATSSFYFISPDELVSLNMVNSSEVESQKLGEDEIKKLKGLIEFFKIWQRSG